MARARVHVPASRGDRHVRLPDAAARLPDGLPHRKRCTSHCAPPTGLCWAGAPTRRAPGPWPRNASSGSSAGAGLPRPEANVRIEGYEVDFLWPTERFVVEIDGFAYHSSRARFEADRRRDAHLAAAGYHVIRVTWRQIRDEPLRVVGRLARALGRPEGGP
jgi:hypothetical protein